MHNPSIHYYQTSQHHKDKLYERFEKEQDSVNFIKTLLKLKQKTPSTLTTSSNINSNTIQTYNIIKTLSNDKPQSQLNNNNNILHKRRSSHRVDQGISFKNNIKLNTVCDDGHLKIKKQNIVSRNNNNNNFNSECNKNSLSNVSQRKIKGVVNKFKPGNVNKDKECFKKISLLNVKKCINNNNNRCVLKPKKNDSSVKKKNKVIVVNRNSNNNNSNSISNNKNGCYSNTVGKNKLLLNKQQRKHIPITVINLFGNEDNLFNAISVNKTELITTTTNHTRNLSERIQIENDFSKPNNN